MKPWRICLVSREYPPAGIGGVANYVHLLANGLAAAGQDVTVISGPTQVVRQRRPAASGETTAQRPPNSCESNSLRLYSVQHHKLPIPPIVRRQASGLWDLLERSMAVDKAIARLERTREKFDVIEMPNWGLEALLFSLHPRAPLAIRLSTPLELSHQFKEMPSGRVGFRLHCLLEAIPARRADCVIANSRYNADYCATLYRIPPAKLHVIHHGVTTPPYLGGKTRAGGESVRVLYVGRLQRRKGIHLLLRAIPLVVEKMPHVQFTIAGLDTGDAPRSATKGHDTSQSMTYQDFFMLTAAPMAQRATTFLGHVDKTSLEQLYADCDILVAPSLYESFGLMYAEAMTYGKPVVAFRTGAAPEVVAHNETGILVEPLNINELANALTDLAKDSTLRREMGKKGFERVSREFSVERMVEATLSVYRQAIAARNKR